MNALLSQDVHWLVFSPVTGLHFMPTPFAIHGVTPFLCVFVIRLDDRCFREEILIIYGGCQ